MTTNKKITELTELTEIDLSDDDVLPIVDVSAGTTNKVRKSTLASALAGVSSMSATSPVAVDQSTGAVTVSLNTVPVASGGTGATTAAAARTNLGALADPLTTRGDIIRRGASATERLALGSSGTVLKSDGTDVVYGSVAATELTGTLAVANGGTNATTASGARTSLGAAASGANTDITSLGGLTTDIAVADGGTGASDAATARSNLGAAASGSNSDITALTGLTTDLSVAQGGTGAGTFTANGVLFGNGTSAIAATATGTSGQVLTSNGSGSAPTFQDLAGGLSVYAAGEVVSGSTTFSRAVWTDITFTETADSGTTFNGTTFTVPTGEGGVYEIIAWAQGDYTSIGNDGEGAGIRFDKNSGTILAEANFLNLDQADRNQVINTAYMGSLAAGDTIVVEAQFIDGNASGNATLKNAAFTIKKVA